VFDGDIAKLTGRNPLRILYDTGGVDAECGECLNNSLAGVIIADYAGDSDFCAEGTQIGGDVSRPSESGLSSDNAKNRNGGFGRNALYVAAAVIIQHQVTDH